jgi:2-keto-4-pentenoate hydratase
MAKLTDLVEVEGKLAGDGAVEARLEVGRPVLAQDVLAASVFLADAADARENVLAAVDVLDGRLSEEKVHVLAHVKRTHKVRL